MTNLEKAIKLLTYIKRHEPYSFERYVIKNGILYLASWSVDGHNGDIEDYKEVEARNQDFSDLVILEIEGKMIQIKEELERRAKRQKIKDEFYSS
jgi:hypothetical protein